MREWHEKGSVIFLGDDDLFSSGKIDMDMPSIAENEESFNPFLISNAAEKFGSDSSNDYERPRLKDRSAMFKARVDVISEPHMDVKARRENHIEKIRQLQVVKEKLSSQKAVENFEHDFKYDLSSEMRATVGQKLNFDIGMDSVPENKKHEYSESASSKDVTLEGIVSLLDSRLSPLPESMSDLESKFEAKSEDKFEYEVDYEGEDELEDEFILEFEYDLYMNLSMTYEYDCEVENFSGFRTSS